MRLTAQRGSRLCLLFAALISLVSYSLTSLAKAPSEDQDNSNKLRRPQLSAEQAQAFSIHKVLQWVGPAGAETLDPWDPLSDPLLSASQPAPDYTVDRRTKADGVRQFHSIQAAVNRAVQDSLVMVQAQTQAQTQAQAQTQTQIPKRLFILIQPGVYHELLYVPASPIPLTLIGASDDARKTKITANLDAATSSARYVQDFYSQFVGLDASILAMADLVKARPTIGTFGSMVVWVRNQGFQIKNMSIENAYNKATGNAREECGERSCGVQSASQEVYAQTQLVHHQAVALQIEGADKVHLENVRLLGFQDTLFLKSATPGVTSRSFFHRAYIEGDVDFIFGDTTAYFYESEVKSLGDRSTSYIGAPNTHHLTKYGFVFDHVNFTHDGSPHALAGKFYLARQWFSGARCTPYSPVPIEGYACVLGEISQFQTPKGSIAKATLATVGKMVILNSRLGAHIHKSQPWSDWNKPGTLPYRPAQFTSDDHWRNLRAAGIDPLTQLDYPKPAVPPAIFLAEFNNTEVSP